MAIFTRVTASNRSGSTVDFRIEGTDALQAKLHTLPQKVQRKLVGASIRAGLRAIAKAVRAQADPSFKKAVGYRYTAKKGGQVGVNVGKKKGRGFKPHFGLYVMGSRRRRTREGYDRGTMPANPVVDIALIGTERQAMQAAIANLKKGIEREASRG